MTQITTPEHNIFSPEYWSIKPLSNQRVDDIEYEINHKTKPPGSLGQLEQLALQLAQTQLAPEDELKIEINKPAILLFAGDHGIAQNSISIAPQAVTQQMLLNFLNGGAAINAFCQSNEVELKVIDAGTLAAIDSPALIQKRVAAGTEDFSKTAAMSEAQCQQALRYGAEIAQQQIEEGSNVIGFGEMGIGNTSAASALLSALTTLAPKECAGRGTGISDEQFQLKVTLLEQAQARLQKQYGDTILEAPIALQEVGGFEIAQITGAMLATAAAGKNILVDGFIISAAALVACRIAPEARDYMIFAHNSAERAHQEMLQQMNAEPLLDLGLRLGEGTGAALAIPLLKAACQFFNQMATFESAGVSN